MSFDRISLANAVRALAALAIGGLVAVFLLTWLPSRAVQVNGPVYQTIAADKDLLADVLPPPLYPIDAYLLMVELSQERDTGRRAALAERLAAAERDFNARAEHWDRSENEPRVKAALASAEAPARAFFAEGRELASAAAAGDAPRAAAALERARDRFAEHRPAVDRLSELLLAQAAAHERDAEQRLRKVFVFALSLGAIVIALITLAAVFTIRSVGRSVARLNLACAQLADAVSRGDLAERADPAMVHRDFRQVVQGMNRTMEACARPMALTVEYVTALSDGRVLPPIAERFEGEFERVKDALNDLLELVNQRGKDIEALIAAAVEGRLDHRADPGKYKGYSSRMIDGINRMLDALTGPLRIAAEAVARISRGDIPARLSTAYRGEFEVLRQNLNGCIDAVTALISDANALAEAGIRGDLSNRADEARHQGDFRKIISGVNATLDAVIGPLTTAARCVEQISRGEIPPPITEAWAGDYSTLRDSLNTCIEAVNRLVADADGLAQAAVTGELSTRADPSRHQGDFRRIVEGVNRTLDAVLAPVNEAAQTLERLARRDLRARVSGQFQGDHARLKESLNSTAQALHDALSQVSAAVDQVSSAATQIASSSQAVASGASQQASSLEETSASVQSVASMTKQSADNAQQANVLALTARSAATDGSAAVEQLQGAMGKIKQSAEGTSQIIRDVSEIAFQTNLLALNAAVEAARAGEAGRGFAVVAEEVRSLALRAKEAATKTEELIRQSVKQAGEGELAARQVAGKLEEIVQGVSKVTDIVSEIAAAAEEQTSGIDQVNKAVVEMDKVTQQNAASAEESSSAASELSGQAEELAAMVATFQLEQGGQPTRVRRELRAL
jgi:methyl-accepting chemotaxis protein